MTTTGVRPRILIVDDEAAHMQALCDTLRNHDYDTCGFVSGDAALASLQAAGYDLLLADLMMPGMDGIALVQAARLRDPDLACIIMTGEGTIASAVRAMKVGALDYIIKPFKVSTILPILARALDTRALRMANARLEQRLREHAAELHAVNQDLEQARRQAERASQEKSTFLSNMSHELRTPLNAIIGFAQILTSDKLPSSPQEKKVFSNHILQSGRHLLTLINEILDLAKVEAGMMSLSLEAVPLAEVLLECQVMLEPQAAKGAIALRFPPAGNQHVLADRTRLKQILINLLSNAIKYNRERGSVEVSCTQAEKGRVRISVADNGAGLDSRQMAAMFQPFNRLGQETSGAEGTGIGLVLSKRLVEAMQGAIGCASTQGVGSTFWIELGRCAPPEARSAEPAYAILPTPAGVSDNGRKKLLYVEDNPANLQVVRELLLRRRDELELLSASDGQRGLELARRHQPQLIMLGLNLPGMDGATTRRLLQEDPRTAHIPVIAITASAQPGDVLPGLVAGFFRYISKPLDLHAFGEAIDSALRVGASCNE
ncbi:response regulator [Rugamonas sp. CCM 8940]|uniref:response regulator n=1 Tax=Rugamonas sp. CCM 8940 TaxID=2765359 RepID=UPI0018F6CFFA|nr:response regulator [Rugamonas sp. CCM 8940]MBJ7309270.1 response regulator [Rugamonas sp. CCM 8940]